MDNFTLPPLPPIIPPSIYLRPKSNIPKILFVLILLSIITLLVGAIFFIKPFNLFQPKKIIISPTPTITKNFIVSSIPINIKEGSPSSEEGIKSYPKYNVIGFNGKVQEKGKDYLVLTGGNKTITIKISNEIKIYMINKSEFSKKPDQYLFKSSRTIPFSEIKIGSNVRVLGKGNEKLLTIVIFIGVFL